MKQKEYKKQIEKFREAVAVLAQATRITAKFPQAEEPLPCTPEFRKERLTKFCEAAKVLTIKYGVVLILPTRLLFLEELATDIPVDTGAVLQTVWEEKVRQIGDVQGVAVVFVEDAEPFPYLSDLKTWRLSSFHKRIRQQAYFYGFSLPSDTDFDFLTEVPPADFRYEGQADTGRFQAFPSGQRASRRNENVQAFEEELLTLCEKHNCYPEIQEETELYPFHEATPEVRLARLSKGLEKLTRKYKIVLQCVGGVLILEETSVIPASFVYLPDAGSGDLMPNIRPPFPVD